eukprot:Hpha_TRINITY_DN9029_c0_g1::TRINITY_DN9029_c0_g1_i1::g.141709::m.141709
MAMPEPDSITGGGGEEGPITVADIIAATREGRKNEYTFWQRAGFCVKRYADRKSFFMIWTVGNALLWCSYAASTMERQDVDGKTSYNKILFSVLIILNALFSLFYAVMGVRQENNFQLGCYAVTSLTLAVRGGMTVKRESDGAGSYLLFSLSVCCTLVTLILIYPVVRTFGWKIFRRCGGDESLAKLYMHYEMFNALVRLDVQFLTMCFVLFLCFLDGSELFSIPLIMVSYPSDILIHYAVKREMRKTTLAWLFFKTAVPTWWVYVLYKYLGCYSDWTDCHMLGCQNPIADIPPLDNSAPEQATPTLLPLTPVAERYHDDCLRHTATQKEWIKEAFLMIIIQALIVRVCLFISTVLVFRNYGKGLKEGVFDAERRFNNRGKDPQTGLGENLIATPRKSEGAGIVVAS